MIKLIDDWRAAWRYLSVQSTALNAALLGGWLAVPDDLKASVPQWLVHTVVLTLLGTSILGRIIKQEPKS